MRWKSTTTLLMALGLGLIANRALAQQGSDPQPFDDLRARIEQQDKQIQELQSQMSGLQQGTTATATATPTAYAPPGAPASPGVAPPSQYEVGSDLSIRVTLKDGLFLWLETPNKDFTMHLGGWMQLDNVWWNESTPLNAKAGGRPGAVPQGVATGVATGGIGDLQDGCYFRRVRPFVEGTFWETGEYRLILALENIQYDNTGFDEFWVGQKDIPVINMIRVGHVKDPMGLEGDMTSSSRCMTFMERSSYSAAIELEQNFVTGIWMANNYFDERVTWQAAAFRPDLGASSGDYFGDGQSGLQGRVTALPIYKDEGRELLHLGLSGGWRNGTANLANGYTGNTIELRSRPELRDDQPAGQALPTNSDNTRMVDTGVLVSDQEYIMGLEALYVRGPLSFQAEYGWNWVNNVSGVIQAAASPPVALPGGPHNYVFSGGYLQVAYTLTGEYRHYDKRIGTLAREYFGHEGPYEKGFLVRDADGHLCWGLGAWELAARYSYVNLNDGTGLDRIAGGEMQGVTVGLNWYVNNNLNVMLDYVYNYRSNLYPGGIVGWTDGVGARVQFQF
jgi:phosphate-selective porin OprO/OprP